MAKKKEEKLLQVVTDESAAISKALYDPEEDALFLRWRGKRQVYRYDDVSDYQADNLSKTSSPGRYSNSRIKPKVTNKVASFPSSENEKVRVIINPNGTRQRQRSNNTNITRSRTRVPHSR